MDDALRAAGEENCTKKVKVVPKRRAREWPLRAAAKLPVHTRKITAEVSEVGQGVGIWVARTLVDCREWRCDRLTLGGSWWERDCERTEPKNVSRPLDEMTASSSPSRWTPRRRRGPSATHRARPRSDLRDCEALLALGCSGSEKSTMYA